MLFILQDFKEAVNACSVEYLKPEGILRIISRDESTPRRVAMLQEMHFRNVSQRSILYKRTEEVARNLVGLLKYSFGFRYLGLIFLITQSIPF